MCVKDKIIILPSSVLHFFLPFLQFLGNQTQLHIKFHSLERKNNNNSKESKNFIMFGKNKIYWAMAKSFANISDGVVLEVLNPFDGVT